MLQHQRTGKPSCTCLLDREDSIYSQLAEEVAVRANDFGGHGGPCAIHQYILPKLGCLQRKVLLDKFASLQPCKQQDSSIRTAGNWLNVSDSNIWQHAVSMARFCIHRIKLTTSKPAAVELNPSGNEDQSNTSKFPNGMSTSTWNGGIQQSETLDVLMAKAP